MEATKILFFKQTAWHCFMELGIDLAKVVGPCVMYTSVQENGQIGNLRVLKSPPYRRDSDLRRLWSWFCYFFIAVKIAWKEPTSALLFIVAQPPYLPLIGYLRHILSGQKYVVWVDDIFPDALVRHGRLSEHHILVKLWKWLNRLMYGRASCVLTLGPRMAEVLSQYVRGGRDKIVIVPTWVDPKVIRPLRKEENPFAIQQGQVNKLTVLYSGNLGLSYNLDTMVQAAVRLRHRSDIHFMVIGAGSRWGEIESASKELANFSLLPYQPDEILPYSLATGDIGVVSLESKFNGISMPSKTYYAMAAGSALLCMTEKGSDLEMVVEQHQCGVTVQPGNVDNFVEAVLRFADDKNYLNRCRNNARIAAEYVFSRHVNVSRVSEIVNSISKRI
jgi:glycosyltransferase involved in cell wall biosynthesis